MNRAILTCDSLEKPRRMNSDTELWFFLPRLCMVIYLLKTNRTSLFCPWPVGGRTELIEVESHAQHLAQKVAHKKRFGQTFAELDEKGKVTRAVLALGNKSEGLDPDLNRI